jgi:hypothetical protein
MGTAFDRPEFTNKLVPVFKLMPKGAVKKPKQRVKGSVDFEGGKWQDEQFLDGELINVIRNGEPADFGSVVWKLCFKLWSPENIASTLARYKNGPASIRLQYGNLINAVKAAVKDFEEKAHFPWRPSLPTVFRR